jgi:hypothetical protein
VTIVDIGKPEKEKKRKEMCVCLSSRDGSRSMKHTSLIHCSLLRTSVFLSSKQICLRKYSNFYQAKRWVTKGVVSNTLNRKGMRGFRL